MVIGYQNVTERRPFMDFIALANLSGYIRAGDPKNNWQKKFNSPVNIEIQDNPEESLGGLGVSSVNMKSQVGAAMPAVEKSVLFSDILRAACERKLNSRA